MIVARTERSGMWEILLVPKLCLGTPASQASLDDLVRFKVINMEFGTTLLRFNVSALN